MEYIPSTANKSAGFLPLRHGADNGPVNIKILQGHNIQQHNHINIAGFSGFAPAVAALQPKISQARTKGLLQLRQEVCHPCFSIDHSSLHPLHTVYKDS